MPLGARPRLAWAPLLLLAASCARTNSPPISEAAPPAKPMVQVAIAESEPDPVKEADPPARKARSSLPEPVLRQLYTCWLESPYPYMFDAPRPDARGPHIEQVGEAGMFMSGIGGIMHYGSLSTCMGRQAGVDKRSYSAMNTVEAFAGMPVGTPGAQWRDPMSFNVEIVKWGRASLIPDPGMLVMGDWTAGELYKVMFQRFFRLMAHSYVAVHADGRASTEEARYFAATRSGRDGLEYLENRFAGELQEYGGSYDGTQWTPAMSFGFWLRRRRDGTADELWAALREMLELYDPQWLELMRSRSQDDPAVAKLWPDAALAAP